MRSNSSGRGAGQDKLRACVLGPPLRRKLRSARSKLRAATALAGRPRAAQCNCHGCLPARHQT
eukprot:7179746-Pyramimonas_sp.AAC.1